MLGASLSADSTIRRYRNSKARLKELAQYSSPKLLPSNVMLTMPDVNKAKIKVQLLSPRLDKAGSRSTVFVGSK